MTAALPIASGVRWRVFLVFGGLVGLPFALACAGWVGGTASAGGVLISGAVLALTRELAIIHARENIRVNALCPGPVETPLLLAIYGDDLDGTVRLFTEVLGFGVAEKTPQALAQLEAIAGVDGVDAVFVGPADLSASMGHVGNASHPEVQAAIEDAIARILQAGKAPGILTPDEKLAQQYLALGAVFVAVGLDTQILMRQTAALAARFKAEVNAIAPAKGSTY